MDYRYKENRIRMFPNTGVVITALEALGNKIVTKEYGKLIDFQSGCWAAVLGHSPKEVVDVVTESVGKLFHTHQYFSTEHPSGLINELIIAADLKGRYRGTFISSGSEAVSLAVTLAQNITKRKRNLSFKISYHGTSNELRLPRDPELWEDLDIRDCLGCNSSNTCDVCGKFNNIEYSQISSFLFEAGNSGGLVLCPPDKLIAFLARRIRGAEGYVIANEVTTGFGRTGKWFGFQHYDYFNREEADPDFIAIGKGLGNGYPISGVLVKAKLADMVESSTFKYVQSHIDDPLGCIIARKVTEIIKRDGLVEKGCKTGEYLRERLSNIAKETGALREIRGRGMMNVAILKESYNSKKVFQELLKKGFFVGYSEFYNYIHLYPALITEIEDVDGLCNALEQVLKDVYQGE